MAARGTEFIGLELLKQVASNYDRRIDQLCEEINELQALSTSERHAAWRVAAERAVLHMADRIQQGPRPTDAELLKFELPSAPYPGEFKYTIRSKEAEIERLGKARDKALAYVRSLAATDGVVTLGAADLRRIGYAP